MVDVIGITISMKTFFHIMTSFAFFVGITLMISPEAFESLNRALQKEYGLKRKIVPQLEDKKIEVVDQFIMKNRTVAGLVITAASFILLLLNP
ncbi:MAG: hypothetical protein ABIJ41_00895 [Candidatus Omnitrophota bacterium]